MKQRKSTNPHFTNLQKMELALISVMTSLLGMLFWRNIILLYQLLRMLFLSVPPRDPGGVTL